MKQTSVYVSGEESGTWMSAGAERRAAAGLQLKNSPLTLCANKSEFQVKGLSPEIRVPPQTMPGGDSGGVKRETLLNVAPTFRHNTSPLFPLGLSFHRRRLLPPLLDRCQAKAQKHQRKVTRTGRVALKYISYIDKLNRTVMCCDGINKSSLN